MPAGLIDILEAGVTDDDGLPLALGTVTSYLAGTTTPQDLYQDFALGSPHSNPCTLDDAGRIKAYSSTRVKLLIKSAAGVTVRTVDNVNLADTDLSSASAATLAGDGLTAPGDGTVAVAVDTNNLAITADTVTFSNRTVTTVTAATYTSLIGDELIKADATSNGITITLIAATSYRKKRLKIRKTDNTANTVIVDGNASETVGGLTTVTLKSQGSWIEIYSDGSNWQVVGYYNWVRSTTSTGTYTRASGTLADVTNLTASIDVLGGPVRCQLEHDQDTTRGSVKVVASGSEGSPEGYLQFQRGSTNIGFQNILATNSSSALNYVVSVPLSSFVASDSGVTAGATTYKVQAGAAGTIGVSYAKLKVETWL